MQFDRTCSRGLNRHVFAIDATIDGFTNEAVNSSSNNSNSSEEEALRHVLRDILATAFGLPVGDVLLLRAWKGLDIHAILDAGPLSHKQHFLQVILSATSLTSNVKS